MMLLTFFVVLYDILTVFLLNIFLSGLSVGKLVSRIFRNSFVIFVFTFWLNGGVYHVIFLDLFLFLHVSFSLNFSLSLYPASFSALSYIGFASSNSALVDDNPVSLLAIMFGSCFLMQGGWLDSRFTYTGLSLSFLYGLCVPVSKFRMEVCDLNIGFYFDRQFVFFE